MQPARFFRAARRAVPLVLLSSVVVAPALAQETTLDPLRAAAKASPTDAAAALALGRALRRAGHEQDALIELRRGFSLPAGRTGDVALGLHWEIAKTHMALKDFGAALVSCRVVLSLPGGATSGHACAAEAHLVWQRSSEALQETALALKGTKSYEAKVAEGRAYEVALKEKEAEASLREAIQWKPDAADAHFHLGRLLVHVAGRRDDGVAELRAAVRLDPNGPEAAFELASALPVGAEAAQLLEKATRERPGYGEAWLKLALIDLDLGKVADAKRAADAAIKLLPQDIGAQLALGRVALAEGRADDAIKAAEAALKLVSNSAKGKLLLADGWAKKGEIDVALEHYQAAWGLDHGDPAALVNASVACHAAGRDTSAKAYAQRATQEFPSWAPAWAALGDALVGQKEPAAAKAAYEKALKGEGPIDRASIEKKIAALPK